MMIEIDDDTFEFLFEAKRSLKDYGSYETYSAVIKELCMVYFSRGE